MEQRDTQKEVNDLFKSFEDVYKTILKNKNTKHCQYTLDKDGVWKKLILNWVLEYFVYNEEYEKCSIMKKYIDSDLIAPPEKQIELNKNHEFYVRK